MKRMHSSPGGTALVRGGARLIVGGARVVSVHAGSAGGRVSDKSGWSSRVTLLDANATFVLVLSHICHSLICCFVLRRVRGLPVGAHAGIAEVEAEISNGVVALGCFQHSDGIFQAILLDAVIEALALHLLRRDANDLLDAARGIHDGQSACEAVEEKSGAWFVGLLSGTKVELG